MPLAPLDIENILMGDDTAAHPGDQPGPDDATPPAAPPDRVIGVTEDGYLFDESTGEILGYQGDHVAWRPQSPEDVEWALSRRAEIESGLAAVRLRKAAVLANFEAIERGHERRLAGWDWRFRPDVVAFARASLGGKSRTAQFENGAVKFRTAQGTNRITDQAAAVAFVEGVKPELVKVERSVGVKAVLEVAEARGANDRELSVFLHSTGPRENVIVETGIGKAGR